VGRGSSRRPLGVGSHAIRAWGSMRRLIIGFHEDDEGHLVADLECGHSQHVRHEPPWQVRAQSRSKPPAAHAPVVTGNSQ
jgi:Protein of unknown function (DUF3565)